jgi:hypothetical protein
MMLQGQTVGRSSSNHLSKEKKGFVCLWESNSCVSDKVSDGTVPDDKGLRTVNNIYSECF